MYMWILVVMVTVKSRQNLRKTWRKFHNICHNEQIQGGNCSCTVFNRLNDKLGIAGKLINIDNSWLHVLFLAVDVYGSMREEQ